MLFFARKGGRSENEPDLNLSQRPERQEIEQSQYPPLKTLHP
jgi:hypothetical protein